MKALNPDNKGILLLSIANSKQFGLGLYNTLLPMLCLDIGSVLVGYVIYKYTIKEESVIGS